MIEQNSTQKAFSPATSHPSPARNTAADLYQIYPTSVTGHHCGRRKGSADIVAEPRKGKEDYLKSVSGAAVAQELDSELLELYDELVEVVAANHFYFDAMCALVSEFKLNVDEHTCMGISLMSEWLQEKDEAVLVHLDELRNQLQRYMTES